MLLQVIYVGKLRFCSKNYVDNGVFYRAKLKVPKWWTLHKIHNFDNVTDWFIIKFSFGLRFSVTLRFIASNVPRLTSLPFPQRIIQLGCEKCKFFKRISNSSSHFVMSLNNCLSKHHLWDIYLVYHVDANIKIWKYHILMVEILSFCASSETSEFWHTSLH